MSKTTLPACPVFRLPVPSIHCHCLRRSPSLPCPKSRPPTHLRLRSPPSRCGPAAPCRPGSRRTDFLLLLTPDSSSQKGAPAPGATPPRSSPSARKMANNQGNNAQPSPPAALRVSCTRCRQSQHRAVPAFAAACGTLKGSARQPGLLVHTASKPVKHLKLSLGLWSATPGDVAR